MTTDEAEARATVVAAMRELSTSGLNHGTTGNASLRFGSTMLITPSAVPADELAPDLIAAIDLDDEDGRWTGPRPPSTEWRIHRDVLRARPAANAVVHTHSPFATVVAIARRTIPAVHYMIAAFGGTTVPCSAYATFGSEELSRAALAALEGRNGCLLANHGALTLAPTMGRALWLAGELETLAFQYHQALLVGDPVILTDEEIAAAAARFSTYGRS